VSGGADSLALLLLARAARPGEVEAATVDHGLRPEARAEAEHVALVCAELGVPNAILSVEVAHGNLQSEARQARYAALAGWMGQRGLGLLASAHHADDQAETLLMRLMRGSGLAGLAGVRSSGTVPGSTYRLIRPLLNWRKQELETLVRDAGIEAVVDPSNVDDRFDRARLRKHLAEADWIDSLAMARSASHLADAQEALDWAADREWEECVTREGDAIAYRPSAPRAIQLIVMMRALRELGGEPRGSALADLLDALDSGQGGNLAGVLVRSMSGKWVLRREPPRR
jgi:tRNA(Ile)-lysidine synthase